MYNDYNTMLLIKVSFTYLFTYYLLTFMNSLRLSYIASHTSGIKLEIDDFETLKKILQSAVAVSSCHKMQGHFQYQSW